MANKTINELSPVTLSSTSEFAVYQNGSTGKATLQNILGSEDFLYADDQEEPTGEVEFESADTTLTPSSSVSVDLLTGNDSWGQRFAKVSQMFKNVRYLLSKLGTTDISTIGNGTITGAINTLNNRFTDTGWLNIPDKAYVSSAKYRVKNGICYIDLYNNVNQIAGGSWLYVGQLPSQYKPSTAIHSNTCNRNGPVGEVQVNSSDGKVAIYLSVSTSTWISCSLSFPVG